MRRARALRPRTFQMRNLRLLDIGNDIDLAQHGAIRGELAVNERGNGSKHRAGEGCGEDVVVGTHLGGGDRLVVLRWGVLAWQSGRGVARS